MRLRPVLYAGSRNWMTRRTSMGRCCWRSWTVRQLPRYRCLSGASSPIHSSQPKTRSRSCASGQTTYREHGGAAGREPPFVHVSRDWRDAQLRALAAESRGWLAADARLGTSAPTRTGTSVPPTRQWPKPSTTTDTSSCGGSEAAVAPDLSDVPLATSLGARPSTPCCPGTGAWSPGIQAGHSWRMAREASRSRDTAVREAGATPPAQTRGSARSRAAAGSPSPASA